MRAKIDIRPNLIAPSQQENFEILLAFPKTHLPAALIGDVIKGAKPGSLSRSIGMLLPVQLSTSEASAADGAPKVHAHGRISTDLNTPACE